jgi:hypothetical protein
MASVNCASRTGTLVGSIPFLMLDGHWRPVPEAPWIEALLRFYRMTMWLVFVSFIQDSELFMDRGATSILSYDHVVGFRLLYTGL